MALRRVDGGPWERVMHDVAPFSPGSRTQCEPDAAYDPTTGLYHLFFIADGSPAGLFARTSRDLEHFPAPPEGKERHVVPLAARPGVAFDPFDQVWRFSFDAYDGSEAVQSWAQSLDSVTSDEILAHNAILHTSEHDLHLDVHLEGSPNVLQSVTPQFPNPDEVLFFYTGIGTSGFYRVFGQRCTRR